MRKRRETGRGSGGRGKWKGGKGRAPFTVELGSLRALLRHWSAYFCHCATERLYEFF